jgi:undecaprenyl-diphosphatase
VSGDRSRVLAALAVLAVGATIFGLALLSLDGRDPPGPLDRGTRDAALDLAGVGVRDVAEVLTLFGSLPAVAASVLVGVLLLAIARRPRAAIALAVGFAAVIVAIGLIKSGVGRARPPGAGPSITSASFPSGHAAYATAYTALALTLLGDRAARSPRRLAVVAVAAALSVAIGLTRVVLDVHYLSDVVAGWALGAAILALAAAASLAVARMRNTERSASASSRPRGHVPP